MRKMSNYGYKGTIKSISRKLLQCTQTLYDEADDSLIYDIYYSARNSKSVTLKRITFYKIYYRYQETIKYQTSTNANYYKTEMTMSGWRSIW